MEMKVIDVSKHQGMIDWEKAKDHVDGVIIRCGYGSNIAVQDDKYFVTNVEACLKYGIPFGVYLYSYAKTVAMAKDEAAHVLRLLRQYKGKLSFPVYYDLEEAGTEKNAVERAIAFGDIIEAEGYWCGIYANQHWWNTYLKDELDRFTKWVARYSDEKPEGISGTYDMWQYSSKGSVPGIKGNVDMNICYRDFPAEINGEVAIKNVETPKRAEVELKSNDAIVEEVIAGKWSVGVERKTKLTEAGYDYETIQALVNEQLKDDATVKYYVVRSGDTLTEIAKEHGTTYLELAKLNGIANPNKIYVGQKIRIK